LFDLQAPFCNYIIENKKIQLFNYNFDVHLRMREKILEKMTFQDTMCVHFKFLDIIFNSVTLKIHN